MAFLNEQGVKTLWGKIKDYTGKEITTAIDAVEAKIPVEALTIKGNGTAVETFDGSNAGVVDIVAGDNITVKAEPGKITIESSGELKGIIDEAKKVSNPLTLKVGDGTTAGTTTTTFDGSAPKEVNITPDAIGAATTTNLNNVEAKITNILVADDDTKVKKAASADTATTATNATTATKVSSSLSIKMKNDTTTYDGSEAKEVNITPEAIGAQVAGTYATKAELESTEAEIAKIINGNTTVKKAASADTATTATSAGKLTTPVTIALNGDVTGSASFDGSADISITATVADDSHAHTTYATKSEHNNLVAKVNEKLEQSDLDNYATKDYADTAEADAISAAKTYTDEAIAKIYEVDNEDTITSILELSAAIKDNDDAIDSLNQIAGTKLPNTTAITAGAGIEVTNSGVLKDGVEIKNTGIRTLAVGTGNNGTTKVNGTDTALVKGLNTAAYKADTYFATATGLNDLVARVTPIESGYVKEFEFKMANATKTDGTDVASATVAGNKATITLYAIPDSFFDSEFFN